jgi:hypothetical protein
MAGMSLRDQHAGFRLHTTQSPAKAQFMASQDL